MTRLTRITRRTPLHTLALAVLAAAVGAAALVPSLAAAGSGPVPTPNTVYIVGSKKSPLKFVAPETITNGEELKIVNTTVPKQVGPHTFALVDPSLMPKTHAERKKCFPTGTCGLIAKWFGVKGEGPPTKNPVKAGRSGWSTEGDKSHPGDAWFTSKHGQTFSQEVNVDTSEGAVTIHFMCAIHPWMQGSIEVLPK